MKSIFITIEGIDGSGKSTGSKFLVTLLREKGYDVIHTREPGGTVIAEEIRNLLLTIREGEQIMSMTELLLFNAARAQHIEAVIKPALEAGKIIVSDRFSDSSYAYQGVGRGFIGDVLELERIVHKGFEPNYTLFFDVTLEESIKRISSRPELANRLDDETLAFKEKVFKGYNIRFAQHRHRMYKIDAMQSIDNVNDQITFWVNKIIKENS